MKYHGYARFSDLERAMIATEARVYFSRAIDMSRKIAIDMARELNGNPKEAQNWRALEDHDDLPEYDYLTLYAEFGKVTAEMASAYKSAFNDAFVGVTV